MILKPRATFIGSPLLEYESLDSTNVFSLELVSKSNPTEGTTVLAHFQSSGKGQYGRAWDSKARENITLSIILLPTFLDIKSQFYLNVISSLAVADMLEYYVKDHVKIKWPNDVYIGDNKICGILIQNSLKGSSILNAVVGIGINVNQELFPKDIPNPTSIKKEVGNPVDLTEVRELLFGIFEKYYLDLKKGEFEILSTQYQDRLYKKGVTSKFKIEDKTIDGIIHSINNLGQLVITIDGKEESFSKTEIQYLK